MAQLVFVHGAGDSGGVWEKQVETFSADHEVLVAELPGHGARLGQWALSDHAQNGDELARMVRERGFDAPVLVGHSAGGAVVLELALRHPALPAGLVLAASGARLRVHPDFLEAARHKMATSAPGTVAGSSVPLEMCVSPSTSDETRDWLAARVGQSTAQAAYADFTANNAFDVMERLGEIARPVLVIGGEDDRMAPPKYQHALAERLPNARLVLVPNAGHYVQAERPDAFNEALETFLASLRRIDSVPTPAGSSEPPGLPG